MTKKNELQVRIEKNLPAEFAGLKENKALNELIEVMPEHTGMLEVIKSNLPEIQRATSLFGKTQSQFMDNMMTVSGNTPIRNLRQILAQMTKTREAIKEANFKLKKKDIEVRIKKREMESETKELEREMLQTEIDEIEANAESTKIYLSGAIRQLANYTEQYNSIMAKSGKKDFTEADFEKEEERYHIMKAFEQALCAARSRGGLIDEGNMIYLTQIGINGAHAQYEVTQFLNHEQALFKQGKAPTHQAYLTFLENMADFFQGSAEEYAKAKGMTTYSESSLIEHGDTRLADGIIPKKVLTRLKKLVALSKSQNENEAKRATEQTEKYLKKHGLTMDQVKKYLKN